MPPPSLIQQYSTFLKNGGKLEDFVFPTGAPSGALMYAVAKEVGASITFITHIVSVTSDNTATIRMIQGKIARTLAIIRGISPKYPERTEENLGLHTIEERG